MAKRDYCPGVHKMVARPRRTADMRGLALATLFLGLCLIDEVNAEKQKGLEATRWSLFFFALLAIIFGA
jgi:hypothetical protein